MEFQPSVIKRLCLASLKIVPFTFLLYLQIVCAYMKEIRWRCVRIYSFTREDIKIITDIVIVDQVSFL